MLSIYAFSEGAEYHTYDYRQYKKDGGTLELSFYNSYTGYNYRGGHGIYFFTNSPTLNDDLILTDSCVHINGGIWFDMSGMSKYVYINDKFFGSNDDDNLGLKIPYRGNVFYVDIYNIFQQLVDCFGNAIKDKNNNYIYSPSATGIKSLKVDSKLNNLIYNLSGQKINSSYRGIIIKNGKKYFRK